MSALLLRPFQAFAIGGDADDGIIGCVDRFIDALIHLVLRRLPGALRHMHRIPFDVLPKGRLNPL